MRKKKLTFIGKFYAVIQRLNDFGEELSKAEFSDHMAQVHDYMKRVSIHQDNQINVLRFDIRL
jgi:hypothetical protein